MDARSCTGTSPASGRPASHWQWADQLREDSPLYFNTYAQGYWVFTRHDAVRDMYKNPQIFSSESITPWEPEPIYRFVPTQIDEPDHITYRRIVNPWFSPRAIDRAQPEIRGICRALVEKVAPAGGCDFVDDFALRYPTAMFLRFIGLDTADTDQFVAWVEDFFGGFGGDPEGLEPMARALGGIRQYWITALRPAARRARSPRRRPGLAPRARQVQRPAADRCRDPRHADGAGARRS